MDQRYAYFDHDADIGLIGRGPTLEAAFEAAAEGMFAIMADLPAVRPLTKVEVAFEEADPELALVTWLNALLAEARTQGLVLSRFHLRRNGTHWTGEAWGEPWRETLERGVEVKGATLTMLAVRPVDGGWEAQCVVDV
ncbi:MAG TPA: archease [Chloroflexota bacterium]|nr:archease [Chloroflexota bacterium]